tara:strand:- start:40843 stop:41178 length:336 start_codon:yes stop_codon:yes gene_type:complete
MSNEKSYSSQTARSYKTRLVDDNFSIHLNIKWLLQICVAISGIVYGYVQITNRLTNLERRMELADSRILELVNQNMLDEQREREAMEERISFFEKELNLNPFSWKRKSKKK